ncbi:HAMP domain-containing sensor histidine kinase [Paenibacillus sp. YPG26]|uniref:sensor histidine kinase n=1 Tax=Paenibacillus sp. YPG26 TaxID=2878915 RepID=UPI00203F74A4|nr:HAMP domain-containing sensor histidine kinase [Paenibacillus sp. YPG26]USB33161.1 HAMP domain-containing histidine kinase [Paenibacillus sp. YPG26]
MKLSTRYLLIIALSIFIFPLTFIGVNLAYYFLLTGLSEHSTEVHYDPDQLKKEWTRKVEELRSQPSEEVLHGLERANTYLNAYVEWVNSSGTVWTITDKSVQEQAWNITDAISYMRKDENDGMYTVAVYLKGAEDEGYVFLKVPQHLIGSKWDVMRSNYVPVWLAMVLLVWSLVIFISWMFFNKLRKRLVKMQSKMEIKGDQAVPEMMEVRYEDEIGQLEHSFNRMVGQLKQSKEAEQYEMELRKSLIANLSHDLRTPLTVIRWHAFRLEQQTLPLDGKKSVQVIQDKVDFLGTLIDNLSSYTLLSNGKLPKHSEETDIRKLVRSSLSSWYVVFEQLGFKIEVELPDSVVWKVDKTWFMRVLDNLLQNIIRHAADGQYVSVRTVKEPEYTALMIEDHGPGILTDSERKGHGIGLSIVSLMLEQMDLAFNLKSDDEGTRAIIYPKIKTGGE